jgi:acetylornithine deacetylase
MTPAERIYDRARGVLERLVGFDTVSHHSNLALIDWVEDHLARYGVASRRIASPDKRKANLLASIGPSTEGGVVLSGHTDVVPVAGQDWRTEPFVVTETGGRLYGRGVADMKGFLALALAATPDFQAANLKRPVHLAFSYDEEIGCFGAPGMIEVIVRDLPRPALVVVGEPTSMEVVSAHKGITAWRVRITGREAHSARTDLGVSAVMAGARLMGELAAIADRLTATADPASPYLPKGASLTIGKVEGGTAGNILARNCSFLFDLRAPAGLDVRATLASFLSMAQRLDAEIKSQAPEGGVVVEQLADVPALAADPDGVAEAFVRRLAGDNGPARVASFASEAGQFQIAGLPAVLCGPGSIDQAHQPDEFIEIAQLQRGAEFMARLVEELR